MKPEHTPCPWTAEQDPNDAEFFAIWHDERGTGCTLAESIGSQANAQLIAAAPELLAALEQTVNALERIHVSKLIPFAMVDTGWGLQLARAAIAKVRNA